MWADEEASFNYTTCTYSHVSLRLGFGLRRLVRRELTSPFPSVVACSTRVSGLHLSMTRTGREVVELILHIFVLFFFLPSEMVWKGTTALGCAMKACDPCSVGGDTSGFVRLALPFLRRARADLDTSADFKLVPLLVLASRERGAR